MKPKLLLRIAAIVMFLHDVGHTLGQLTWKETPDPAKLAVIKQMTENKFLFMGKMRSMGEYFDGFGYASTLGLFLLAAILWIASGATEQNKGIVKKILVIVSLVLLAWGIVELIFFFPFAAAFSLLAFLLTVIATFQLNSQVRNT